MSIKAGALQESQFTIEEAQPSDVPAILRIWVDMMAEHEQFDPRIRMAPGSEAAYRAHLNYHVSQPDSRVSVAVSTDAGPRQVIGFCLVIVNRNLPMFLPPHYGYLSDLAVKDSHRRKGAGRALVDDVKAWLKNKGIETIQLQAYVRNTRANAFWEALDFQPYYRRMWLDL